VYTLFVTSFFAYIRSNVKAGCCIAAIKSFLSSLADVFAPAPGGLDPLDLGNWIHRIIFIR
jgi:hypothetical protein